MWEKKTDFCRITSLKHRHVTNVCNRRFAILIFAQICKWKPGYLGREDWEHEKDSRSFIHVLQSSCNVQKHLCHQVLVLATFNEAHSSRATLRFCIQLTFRMESMTAVGYPQRPWPPQRHLRLEKQNTKVHQGSFIPLQGYNSWQLLSPYSLFYFQCDD